ncbi:uncharacterized protein LOC122659330 [Telopea speciosissima]|uniref:uncharacterized protein LOC122659330 n=1 Tax=Telopea speciosissima TaxID=54955 RepID=UPI001CC7AEC4|nr:uncharacterized protein LOC122659330 [Telopea speciosissima]
MADTTRTIEQFRKLRPSYFKGDTSDPLKATEWIRELEKNFTLLNLTDAQKVVCATYQLQGKVDDWWQFAHRIKERDGQPLTWARSQEVFYKKYFPTSLRQRKEEEFLTLEQHNLSVMDYELKFEDLSKFAPHLVDTEERKARQFERGLRSDLKRIIAAFKCPTYAEVVKRAQIVEDNSRFVPPSVPNTQKKRSHPHPTQNYDNHSKQQRTTYHHQERTVCPKCKKPHSGECMAGSNACFRCGKEGHMAKDCPEQKNN